MHASPTCIAHMHDRPHASPTCMIAHMHHRPHATSPTCIMAHMHHRPHASPMCIAHMHHRPHASSPICIIAHMHHRPHATGDRQCLDGVRRSLRRGAPRACSHGRASQARCGGEISARGDTISRGIPGRSPRCPPGSVKRASGTSHTTRHDVRASGEGMACHGCASCA